MVARSGALCVRIGLKRRSAIRAYCPPVSMGVCVLAHGAKIKKMCETREHALEPPGGEKNHFFTFLFLPPSAGPAVEIVCQNGLRVYFTLAARHKLSA